MFVTCASSLVEAASRDPDGGLVVRGPGRGNAGGHRRPHSMHQNGSALNGGSNPHGRGGGLQELAHNANLSCLLATADTELALRTHFLYEVGGNIGEFLKVNPWKFFIFLCIPFLLVS